MVWTATLAAWRYASLAALVAAAVSPLALAALDAGGSYENLVILAAVFWSLLVFLPTGEHPQARERAGGPDRRARRRGPPREEGAMTFANQLT
jgi:hypothetical protein